MSRAGVLRCPGVLGTHRTDAIHAIGSAIRTLLRRDLLFLHLSLFSKLRFVVLGDSSPSIWPCMLQTAPAHPYPTPIRAGNSWLKLGELGRGGKESDVPAWCGPEGLSRSPLPFADGLQRPPKRCPAAELLRRHLLQRGAQRCVFAPRSPAPLRPVLASLYLGSLHLSPLLPSPRHPGR